MKIKFYTEVFKMKDKKNENEVKESDFEDSEDELVCEEDDSREDEIDLFR
ncbi:Uncharacterised protein [uncultured archaeon]|nr:Uncharacterised protein [uncultured archaeon]